MEESPTDPGIKLQDPAQQPGVLVPSWVGQVGLLIGALLTGSAGGGVAGWNSSAAAYESLRQELASHGQELVDHRLEDWHSGMDLRVSVLEQQRSRDTTTLQQVRDNVLKLCQAQGADCK